MAALDTKVLVRYLVRDDARQQATARNFIRQCVAQGQPLFIPVTVTLELEWVLRSNFKFAKTSIIETLAALLSTQELSFESESAVELALRQYAEHSADFSDCMHLALAAQAGHLPLGTFDRAAAKLDGAKLLV